jgi:hypothetical protein
VDLQDMREWRDELVGKFIYDAGMDEESAMRLAVQIIKREQMNGDTRTGKIRQQRRTA